MSTNLAENKSERYLDHRRLMFNYDFIDKERTRICLSPPMSGHKSRDNSMPRVLSRHFYTDSAVTNGSILKSISPDILSKAKLLVNEAIMKKKIFTIFGPYDKIRLDLKSRGWVEKLTDGNAISVLYAKVGNMAESQMKNVSDDNQRERKVLSNKECEWTKNDYNDKLDSVASLMVLNCSSDLIWSLRLTQIDEHTLKPNQIINHFKKAGSFTTKIGLIKSFNYLGWYEKNNDDVFPRSYILADENEKKAFLDDYYLTACMGLIKLTVQTNESSSEQCDGDKIEKEVLSSERDHLKGESNKVRPSINYITKEIGDAKFKIDRRFPEMAIHYCEFYLKYHNNKDLDQRQVVFCSSKRWEEFFESYYNVTNNGYGIDSNEHIQERCVHICKELKKIHPQFNLDGTRNIWIVKPGAKSRGRGIFCASKFSEINDVVRTTSETLIVQKYIENPLLIYNTKFDIRQWFLVTNWSPLTIWWYRDSYVRFCSQQFTLNDFNESIHLSNNSIQHKYENGSRSKYLPSNNMWDWRSLDKYLDLNGYVDGWKNIILPSMKDIIINILLCSQEEIEDRKNSFELYGADFMVSADDLKTWLLEINSSPCMSPSTDVTARLTKSVLEDIMKVILDYPENVNCDTGQFELLYKQSPFSKPVIEYSDKLTISGISIRKPLNAMQPMKREMSPKKGTVQEQSGILHTKMKQVIENSRTYRELPRLYESFTAIGGHRHPERSMNQMSVDLKQKRLREFVEQSLAMEQRRTRSHTQEVNHRLRSSIDRNNSNKTSLYPRQSQSIVATDITKSRPNNGRSLQPIKKSEEEEPHREHNGHHKTIRFNEKHLRFRAANDDNSLISKLQSWKQMDKSQNQRLHQILKAYLPYLD